VLAATTGIASVNLGEGTTINALLKYFDTASLHESHVGGQLQGILGKLWRAGVRRILLDEVSMMDGQQLTILTQALREMSGRGYVMDQTIQDEMDLEGYHPDGPWPIALTLIGDFAQLPPVKAPFAFQSPEWKEYAPRVHGLTEIRRQADREFIQALQAARRGDADTVVDYFRHRLHAQADPNFAGPTILAKNDQVDRFNLLRVIQLPPPDVVFGTRRWGTERTDWKHIPETVTLRDGALVMCLANKREQGGEDELPGPIIYANGDLGTVTHMDPSRGAVFVTLQRTGREVEIEWVERTNRVPLEPGRAKALRAEGHEDRIDGKWEVIGSVFHLPIRVAYATTVHKSQGLSLDHVQVNTRDGFFKTPGMLYVALSRARTAEGLTLIGSVDGLAARCTVSALIKGWV
jgi:ATP-dependent DNA helicase PIF1